jgi:hypothetical protein
VRELQEKLKKNNLDARIDYDFLEAGDNWIGKINQLISEFDYFILALSHDLVQQPETYVYHELELARKRQSRLKPGLKFIIPIKLDNCDIPPFLSDLQVDTIDLSRDAPIDNLVKTIKRDFQLRNR